MTLRQSVFVAGVLVLCTACTKWAYKVPTNAMEPTIKQGDTIWVDHKYYSNHPIERFDIVLFKASNHGDPQEGQEVGIVKRVIGLGGETISIQGGRILIDGRELKQEFEWVPLRENFGPITVPTDEYFLLGDNRGNSFDSRNWKVPTLKQVRIVGKVIEIKHN